MSVISNLFKFYTLIIFLTLFYLLIHKYMMEIKQIIKSLLKLIDINLFMFKLFKNLLFLSNTNTLTRLL